MVYGDHDTDWNIKDSAFDSWHTHALSSLHCVKTDSEDHPLPILNGYWELFPTKFNARGMKLTAILHIVLRLKTNGGMQLLLHTPPQRGV